MHNKQGYRRKPEATTSHKGRWVNVIPQCESDYVVQGVVAYVRLVEERNVSKKPPENAIKYKRKLLDLMHSMWPQCFVILKFARQAYELIPEGVMREAWWYEYVRRSLLGNPLFVMRIADIMTDAMMQNLPLVCRNVLHEGTDAEREQCNRDVVANIDLALVRIGLMLCEYFEQYCKSIYGE